MAEYVLPYGKESISCVLPDDRRVDVIAPANISPVLDPVGAVRKALESPVGDAALAGFRDARSVVIAINDKTRPVPHDVLLPPLLAMLEDLGWGPDAVRLIIATGTHAPMAADEFARVVPEAVLARYRVISHNCDDDGLLQYMGETSRGTPVWLNQQFLKADLRIVVGNIEPHQFMGYSGGVKSAAIGLAGRATVNRNHAMMTHPDACLGQYAGNPARLDVEEIGEMAGVHFALNAILNPHKKLVAVVAGPPRAVMTAGIEQARKICQVTVSEPYDLVIASPGGHPSDMSLYQSQKGLAHAALVVRSGGTLVLVAHCGEGIGSRSYEQWMFDGDMRSHQQVLARFAEEGFRAGVHKAFQISRDASRIRIVLVSSMPPELVKRLLLQSAPSLESAISEALAGLPLQARIAIMPQAKATVPLLA